MREKNKPATNITLRAFLLATTCGADPTHPSPPNVDTLDPKTTYLSLRRLVRRPHPPGRAGVPLFSWVRQGSPKGNPYCRRGLHKGQKSRFFAILGQKMTTRTVPGGVPSP